MDSPISDYEYAQIVRTNKRDAMEIAERLAQGEGIAPWSWESMLVRKILKEWKALARETRTNARGRRPSYNAAKLAIVIEQAVRDGFSRNKATEIAAEKLGISREAVKKAVHPYQVDARKRLAADPQECAMTVDQHRHARQRFESGPLLVRDRWSR